MVTDTLVSSAQKLCLAGQFDTARGLLQEAARQQPTTAAYSLLAQIELEQRQWAAAEVWSEAALSLDGQAAAAWYAKARASKERGDYWAAIACYRRALAIEPGNAAILTSLGTALFATGRRAQAEESYREALAAQPNHPAALACLDALSRAASGGRERLAQIGTEARQQQQAGNLLRAFELYEEALRIAPDNAGAWLSAGFLANALGEQPSSLKMFEKAALLDPTLWPAIEAARRISVGAGLYGKACKFSDESLALRPADDTQIALALTTPAIHASLDALNAARRTFEAGIDAARVAGLRASDPYAAHGMGAFFLAYHGEIDRPLQIKAAQLLFEAIPSLSMKAAHCSGRTRRRGKIRVGFISAFLFNHSIGATTRGLVEKLSRDCFEVFVLLIAPTKQDAMCEQICRSADRAVRLDGHFERAREQIASLELDILFFQDIGMEPTSYFLAFARLAPVQCVSFGHPNTTGIPTIDYFVSNDLYEPDDAASHYSEKLYLLKDLPTLAYYYRPQAPAEGLKRTSFGLHDRDHVYVCPQTLFKLHPDFDALLCAILRRDPQGVLVLIEGQFEDYGNQLRQRFARSLGDVQNRIVFLESMPLPRFLKLLSIADVCLDTPHFNGMNSSLQAFSVGTPIVTLPGRLQRGRHTQAMYRKMGIFDCIATDAGNYVDIALRLGRDKDQASALRRRILAANHVLYEDRRVVEEFEGFFKQAVKAALPDPD